MALFMNYQGVSRRKPLHGAVLGPKSYSSKVLKKQVSSSMLSPSSKLSPVNRPLRDVEDSLDESLVLSSVHKVASPSYL